jgi:hypothetical protein
MSEPTYILRPLPISMETRAFAALVAVGMRLRVGSAKRAELERWLLQPSSDDEAFWADAEREALGEAATLEAWLQGDDRADAGAMMVRRDRLESAHVAMGAAADAELAARVTRALGAALDRIDGDARARPELPERVRGSDVSALRRLAELDPSSWWLDEAATAPLRGAGSVLSALRARRASAPVATAAELALRMRASQLGKSAPEGRALLFAEVVGQEDEEPSGAIVVARVCEEAVTIRALGLVGEEDAPPGLLVHLEAPAAALAVEVTPTLARPPVKVKHGWWVPLEGTAPGEYALHVRVRAADGEVSATLPIVVAP